MINVDDRILKQVDTNEMWFLMHLAKRINPGTRICWPSNATLCEDTGWHIEKLQKVKKSLIKKRLIRVEVRPDKTNLYKVATPYMGVFVNLENLELEEIEPIGKTDTLTENPTDHAHTGKSDTTHTGKSDSKVLTNEVLTIMPLDGISKPQTKSKKSVPAPTNPAYIGFVDVWHRHYPHIGFKFPRDGKVIKNLIEKTREIMKRAGMGDASEDPVKQIEFFDIAIANLPEWYRGKILPVIESHYPTIIDQLTNGKQITGAKGADQFSDFAGIGGVARG